MLLRRLPFKFKISKFFCTLNLDETVIITKSCAKRIHELTLKKGTDKTGLRLSVQGGGCSGFQYVFNMENEINSEEDMIFDKDGAKLIVDKISYDLLKGSTVDYQQDLMKSAFVVINNPQSESACGCGSSFAAKKFADNPAID